jgi:signal transduction histidine kinase
VPKALARAQDGLGRVSTILRSMKAFAHPDSDTMQPTDLNCAIEATLIVARNEYKYVADLITELSDLPPVSCYSSEVNQAVLNIVVNAGHAIADVVGDTGARGTLRVSTRRLGENEIEISDTGSGIPDSIRDRVFDPFFTTKEVGKGTGLGLDISYRIVVRRHHGDIRVESRPGDTRFQVLLPIEQAS